MKKILLLTLLLIANLQAGWMNVDSINIKQKWRNKKLNTDALLYIRASDSLLDTANIYDKSGLIGINTSSPVDELTVGGALYLDGDAPQVYDPAWNGLLLSQANLGQMSGWYLELGGGFSAIPNLIFTPATDSLSSGSDPRTLTYGSELMTLSGEYRTVRIGSGSPDPDWELYVNGDAYVADSSFFKEYADFDDKVHVRNYIQVGVTSYNPMIYDATVIAPLTADERPRISSANTYTGGELFPIRDGSIVLQSASNDSGKSINFIGGTGGKQTFQVYDTTITNIFTDSVNISGNLHVAGNLDATITIPDPLSIDTLYVGDTIYCGGKIQTGDNIIINKTGGKSLIFQDGAGVANWSFYHSNTDNYLSMYTGSGIDGNFQIGSFTDANQLYLNTATGNVGLNISSPEGHLHIYNSSAGTVTANTFSNALVIESGTESGISILTPDNISSNLFFGTPSDNAGALLKWNHNNDLFNIGTANSGAEVSIASANGIEAIRIDSNQYVGINDPTPDARLHVNGDTKISGTLDIWNADYTDGTILFGADGGATTRTDLTNKYGFLVTPSYDNTEEPVLSIFPVNQSATNDLRIGGGSGAYNSMSRIQWYTGNINTLSGSQRMVLDSLGNFGINTTSPTSKLHVNGSARLNNWTIYGRNYTVPTATYVKVWVKENDSTIASNESYRVTLNTLSTGTYTGAVYSVVGGVASVVSSNGFESNHPLLRVNAGSMEVYHQHASTYSIKATVETYIHDNSTAIASSIAGLEDGTIINYVGSIGIDTITPVSKLHVNGTGRFENQVVIEEEGLKLSRSSGSGYIAFDSSNNVEAWQIRHEDLNNELRAYSKNYDGIFTIARDYGTTPFFYLNTLTGQKVFGGTTQQGEVAIYGAPEIYSDIRGHLVINDTTTLAEGNGGGIMFSGEDGTTDYRAYAGIRAYKTNATSGNYDAQLRFQTRKNGSTATTKMTLTEDGDLGIGNTSPMGMIHTNETGYGCHHFLNDSCYGSINTLFGGGMRIGNHFYVDGELQYVKGSTSASAMTFIDGSIYFGGQTGLTNGALWSTPNRVTIDSIGTLVVGSPSGIVRGVGNINADSVFDDGTLLTKYALDYYYGDHFSIRNYPKEKEAVKRFLKYAETTKDIDLYNEFVQKEKSLPSFYDIEKRGQKPSIGAVSQRAWEELEIKTEHIRQLKEKIDEQEKRIVRLEKILKENYK